MKGGFLQLVTKGAEDIHLIDQPEFSYFDNVYKRYTNFGIESMENTIAITPKFGKDIKIQVERLGDLMSKTYLEVTLPSDPTSTGRWTNRVGFNLIKKVEFLIGNTIIEKYDGLFCHLLTELSHSETHKCLLDDLVGKKGLAGEESLGLPTNIPHTLNIPLFLFFCKNYSNSLPLIALSKQHVFIKFYFETKEKCLQSGTVSGDLLNTKLWIDYIFLSHSEKGNFANNSYNYLIEVNQHKNINLVVNGKTNVNLPFKLPTKELIWVVRRRNITDTTDKFTDFTTGITTKQSMINACQIKINSTSILSSGFRKNVFFNYIQPYQFHTGCPDLGINSYSFALYPENLDPSGFLNLNNIQNINFLIKSNIGVLDIYAVCYNILEIDDEICKLKYLY